MCRLCNVFECFLYVKQDIFITMSNNHLERYENYEKNIGKDGTFDR